MPNRQGRRVESARGGALYAAVGGGVESREMTHCMRVVTDSCGAHPTPVPLTGVNMPVSRLFSSLAGLAVVVAVVGAGMAHAEPDRDAAHGNAWCPQLSKRLDWYGTNRARLQHVIDEQGSCSHPDRPPRNVPVAAFDWDNTLTKNDVTTATLAWALRHNKILRPESWSQVNKWLTDHAAQALTAACGTDVPVGAPLLTATNDACADEIIEIRQEARTMDGHDAFAGEWNHRRTVPEYAWVPQLLAGHTPGEVTRYARQARAEALARPVGSSQTVGTHTIPAYVRYYPQMRDLVHTLQQAGIETYVVSAGFEPITEGWSPGVGIDAEHTIGIRSVLRNGEITTRNEGCGGEPASRGETIPYKQGKRCWINQEIFGIHGPDAWQRQPPGQRIILGAGDSDTDVSFVRDATSAHLVINRNEDEIMCRAYDNRDGRWIINPMFIEPNGPRVEPYPCSSTGYVTPDGGKAPVRRADGSVIPDQQDTVHG